MLSSVISKVPSSIPVLGVGADGVLYIVARVAPGTGLYAVGRAIIDAGFGGVRDVSTSGVTQFWKFRRDTPEGEFLERLCCLARQGLPLPPPNEAVALLRAFSWAGEVRV